MRDACRRATRAPAASGVSEPHRRIRLGDDLLRAGGAIARAGQPDRRGDLDRRPVQLVSAANACRSRSANSSASWAVAIGASTTNSSCSRRLTVSVRRTASRRRCATATSNWSPTSQPCSWLSPPSRRDRSGTRRSSRAGNRRARARAGRSVVGRSSSSSSARCCSRIIAASHSRNSASAGLGSSTRPVRLTIAVTASGLLMAMMMRSGRAGANRADERFRGGTPGAGRVTRPPPIGGAPSGARHTQGWRVNDG